MCVRFAIGVREKRKREKEREIKNNEYKNMLFHEIGDDLLILLFSVRRQRVGASAIYREGFCFGFSGVCVYGVRMCWCVCV